MKVWFLKTRYPKYEPILDQGRCFCCLVLWMWFSRWRQIFARVYRKALDKGLSYFVCELIERIVLCLPHTETLEVCVCAMQNQANLIFTSNTSTKLSSLQMTRGHFTVLHRVVLKLFLETCACFFTNKANIHGDDCPFADGLESTKYKVQ